MAVRLRKDAVIARGLVFPETMAGLLDLVDGEGALLYLPPLGVLEDLGEAFQFVLGICVECVLGGVVLVEEAVLGGLEHRGRVLGQGAVCLPDCGDGAVAAVRHGVVEVAYGFVRDFLARISLVFLGDVLLCVDVPLLQVRPDEGYLRCAVVYVRAVVQGVGVEEGR